MEITSINIVNYRSISDLTIEVEKIGNSRCLILLGKNEMGKSSILKAISLLNKDFEFNYSIDCNKTAKKENKTIQISFNLKFNNYLFYQKKFTEIGIPKELHSSIKIYDIKRNIFIHSSNKKTDNIHLWMHNQAIFSNYLYDKNEKSIHKITDIYDGDEKVTKDNIPILIGSSYELLESSNLESLIESKMFNLIDDNTPKSILWRHTDEYLINNTIDLVAFAKSPNISLPLRNIFNISGIKDIESRIKLISNDKEERKQLEQELSKKTTRYINKIWPEHKINFVIDIENMQCSVMVEDKDKTEDGTQYYKMAQRSDGFKQFISILLNLSMENEAKKIKNKIILFDEPEIHLHPSGVRYLRDELLNMSKNNIVIISTHSVYMVDKLHLERHYKVTKENSLTTIKKIEKNNPYEEEVIYEALGTSVYEHIQPNMIVFEGKTDKDLFDAFTNKFKLDLKPVKLGSISADGVEKIPQYTKFIDGKFVKGYVMVDSDKDGVRIKEQIINDNHSFSSKNTFEINDVYQTNIASTLEDLYPKDIIIECINEKFKVDVELTNTPVIKQLERKTKGLEGKINIKELKGFLVQKIITDIRRSQMTKQKTKDKYSVYYKFVEELHKKLKK